MKHTHAAAVLAALCLATAASAKPDSSAWRPTSTTSVSITGPVTLWSDRLVAAGASFKLRQVAQVASFQTDQGDHPARVFAVVKPANPKLLNGNRFCGPRPATWIVAQPITPDGLEIAVFTGPDRPTGQSSPGLCGTFFYNR
jgi:hypothetical protein